MDKTLKLLILSVALACLFFAIRFADPPVATNERLIKFTSTNEDSIKFTTPNEDPIKFATPNENSIKFIAPNQNPITFRTEGATKASFKQFIEALRERLTGAHIHNIPVLRDPSRVEERNRYVTIELSNSETESIQIGIDLTNAYVVAYQAGTRAYFLNDAPESASTYLFPDIPTDNRYTLPFNGTYGDLEGWAHQTREEISLGLHALTHAITFLRSGADDNEERARIMIVIIQMVAEAARFRYISNRVGVSIQNGNPFQPDAAMLSLENNWDNLSGGVQQSDQGTFPNDVTLTNIRHEHVIVNSLTHPTVAVLALMLFVCNPNPNRPPLLIRSIVGKSDTCDHFEPIVHIAGRDGMCVDVYKSDYNNGNSIIMWECKKQENQLWTLKQDKTIRSKGKCLTTYGYSPGSYIMIYDCTTAVAEATYWEIWDNGTIINPKSGLVLSAESSTMGGTLTVQTDEYRMRQGWRTGNDTSPFVTSIAGYLDLCMEVHESNMWLSDCDRNKREQQWALYPDGSIRPVINTNNCLTSEEHKQGATIVLMACSNAWASQRWVFKNDGTIYSLSDDMVMDVKGSDPSLKQIILWQWTGNSNQQWVTLF